MRKLLGLHVIRVNLSWNILEVQELRLAQTRIIYIRYKIDRIAI